MLTTITEDQSMVEDLARRIAIDRLAPHAAALDRGEDRDYFSENLALLAENGFMALNVGETYGGSGADTVSFALTIAALGEACASTAVTVSVTNMVAEVIAACGSDEQKTTHIPRLADGTYRAGAFCLTEAGAGSDPAGMATSARMDGNEWVLNGTKLYITSADIAGIFVVWAVTDTRAQKGKGISCFLVEAGTPGLTVGRAETKTGQTGSATHELHFEDCRIPASALMGEENDGFRIAAGELAGGRIGVAALSLGIARAALEEAKAHVLQRKQFGVRIADMQGIQWMIADRETDLLAARLLILNAAQLKDQGLSFGREASMAKLFASEAAQRTTYDAVQMFGGAGYLRDMPVERHARDARVTTIYEGTSEIQRMIIARSILAEAEQQLGEMRPNTQG